MTRNARTVNAHVPAAEKETQHFGDSTRELNEILQV